jgi:hypothetical protein
MGGKRKYYLSQSTDYKKRKRAKGLHVAIWEFYSGQKVPKGWCVHHKDGDTFNNSFENLECIPRYEHDRIPKNVDVEKNKEHLAKIRPLTKAWHCSEEGRAWHKQHGKDGWKNRKPVKKICIECEKEFETYFPSRTKYCGGTCYARMWRREHPGYYTIKQITDRASL